MQQFNFNIKSRYKFKESCNFYMSVVHMKVYRTIYRTKLRHNLNSLYHSFKRKPSLISITHIITTSSSIDPCFSAVNWKLIVF